MGSLKGVVILVGVALLQCTVQSSSSCKGVDGHPGTPGNVGRDGMPGVRGEKGQAAPQDTVQYNLQSLKGDVGRRGILGIPGPKGYSGDLGEMGPPGPQGPNGTQGEFVNSGSSMMHQSAFSVVRTLNTYPPIKMKLVFQTAIVNTPGDFNLETGTFTCRVPGIYYFVFHASSRVPMCLRLKSEAVSDLPLVFCDYNSRRTGQVLSGGVVLQLTQGQHVWMEGFTETQPSSDPSDKKIIFNGFLLFATS
ncbi:hypothetical protein CRUP_013939 [Coryphaenoides rupestris]|nr:hypothetical protein CRUP_013939 [Coryphaenoides rupestris]